MTPYNGPLSALATIAVLTAVLLSNLGAISSSNPVANGPNSGPAPNAVSATLSVGTAAGTHLSAPFYAVVFEGSEATPKSQQAWGNFMNSTPIGWVRLGGGGDAYDPTTTTQYVAPTSGTHYVPMVGELVNFSWFRSWCYSLSPHCRWLGYLPAEQNNTQAAVHAAQWFHNVLRFVPDLWQFGNEPNAWVHYGKNLTQWSTTDASTPTGAAYATMVRNYIAAVRGLFPNDRFVGIEDACACSPSLVTTLAAVDGKSLAAVAYHNYPWLTNSSTTVSQFFGALASSRALSNTSAHMRAMVTAGCTTCTNLPVQVGEYNAGPVPTHSPFLLQFPGALLLGASVIQALEANISMFTIFNTGSMQNSSSGVILPEGMLYTRILENMTMGTDYPVTVTAKALGGAYALLIKNGTRESLFVVNTNTTHAISFTIGTSLFPVGLSGSYWTWSSAGTVPNPHLSVQLPTSYTMAAESLLLLNNF